MLTSPQWNQCADHPHEMNALVASAFARYPTRSIFAWRTGTPYSEAVLFYRAAGVAVGGTA